MPEVILPAVVFPTLTFGLLFAWPAIDRRLGHHSGEDVDAHHHLLDRQRDRLRHTAMGVAVLAFYVVLFIGGGQDIIAQKFHIALDAVHLDEKIQGVMV